MSPDDRVNFLMESVRSKNSGFSKSDLSEHVKAFGLPGTHKISSLIQQILTEAEV